MDAERFDELIRSFRSGSSRRRLLAGLASGMLAALPFALDGEEAKAKKKRKKKRKEEGASRCLHAQLYRPRLRVSWLWRIVWHLWRLPRVSRRNVHHPAERNAMRERPHVPGRDLRLPRRYDNAQQGELCHSLY